MQRIVVAMSVFIAANASAADRPDAPPATAEKGMYAAQPAVPYTKRAPSLSFRCDGTDPFFFEELEQAGSVGYGETWDETICDDGVEVYADGATSRWKAWRRKPSLKRSAEDQALALVLPLVAFGSVTAVLLGAAAVAAATRLRRSPSLTAACPACANELPISVDAGRTQHMFCPMCGAPCSVDVVGKGASMRAEARA